MKTSRWTIASVLALGLCGPTYADWLVLRSGQRIETKGAWNVRGRQVVFTSRTGALQALPLSDIDVEASKKATAPDPNQPLREALLEGRMVDIPEVEPTEFRDPAMDALAKFIRDPNAPRVKGTLSLSKSFLGGLYEKYPRLASLRQAAIDSSGLDAVRELESRMDSSRSELFQICQQSGADESVHYQDPCAAAFVGALLAELAGGYGDEPEPDFTP
ncbi:MAG: hypothetical protein AMXMBFR36_17520 [Acidobacteriota bacterium]